MADLEWKESRNLENSLAEFLQSKIATESLQVFFGGNSLPIGVRVGFPEDDTWKLPVISVFVSSKNAPRFLVGTNKRAKTRLMIIQIRGLDDGMRQDLAEWVSDTINEGFPYYEYEPSESTPNTPTKTLAGTVALTFVTDAPARLSNVDDFDKFLHNISIETEIN